jgi:2-polyprenyl-3-methyl-5-hydroxy-6-metoxy-1,4-benzoquinol methylase
VYRKFRERFLPPKPADTSGPGWFPLSRQIPAGVLDGLQVRGSGQVSVDGWCDGEPPRLELFADGQPLPLLNEYRVRRPDVARALNREESHFGFVCEFLVRGRQLDSITLRCGGRDLCSLQVKAPVVQPDYGHLFDHAEVLHREDIYGVGPPVPTVDGEILALARALPGSILDFGCGSGALVRALRQENREAHGLELSRGPVNEALRDDVRPHVTLYDGGFPSPLAAGQFESILCSEVLEHIPDWQAAVAEMGRLCRRAAVFTVPDISAIPAGFPHHVVPWHLLESTHVNFFTQRSLQKALAPIFSRVWFGRNGVFDVNGTRLYTSLVAHCER